MESSCEQILKWTEKVLNGGELTEEEAKALIRTKDEDTMLLLACADKIRQSGRSGECARDKTSSASRSRPLSASERP